MKPNALSFRRAGLVLLGLVLLAAFVFVVVRTGPFAPVRVTVAEVTEDSVAPALFGIGTVEARRSYLIGPTAAGRVLRVAVDVGEPVKAGQLLAEMDPVDLDQRVASLEASIARAAARCSPDTCARVPRPAALGPVPTTTKTKAASRTRPSRTRPARRNDRAFGFMTAPARR